MVFREFRYFCSEAFKSIFHNILMTLASLVTVTGCLLFLGTFTLFSLNLSFIADQVQEECKIVAYVDPALSDSETEALQDNLMRVSNVSDAVLETKKEAFENAKAMLAEGGISMDTWEDDDFLRASYTVSVQDLALSADTAKELRAVDGIEEVSQQQDITDNVLNTTSVIKAVLMVAMGVLALIAVFIISNTIKLAVFAREREIHIMKYVGATDWFIRWPFIIEGIIVGLCGGLISLLICMGLYGTCTNAVAGSVWFPFELHAFSTVAASLVLVLLLFGALMGALGSIIAVRRHLKV